MAPKTLNFQFFFIVYSSYLIRTPTGVLFSCLSCRPLALGQRSLVVSLHTEGLAYPEAGETS